MEQRALNRLNMWKAVRYVLDRNQAIWQSNTAFAGAVADLGDCITSADTIARETATSTVGLTKNKLALAEDAIDKTLVMANLARAYARKQSRHELFEAVDFTRGALTRTPLDELAARLNSMLSAATAVKGDLVAYGFLPGMETAAEAAIAAFTLEAPSTRSAISEQSALNNTWPYISRRARIELNVLDDLMILFKDTAPDFVATYRQARIIVDAGARRDADTPPTGA